MFRCVWLVASVSACGFAPQQRGIDAADGTMPDTRELDAALDAPPPCMASGQTDNFATTSICTPWATHDMTNAVVVQGSGRLSISPQSNLAGTHGGCFAIAASTLGPEGLFVEVPTATTGTTAYTAMTAYSTTGAISSVMVVKNGTLSVVNTGTSVVGGTQPYNAVAMRWWRLRPVPTGVVGEYSTDALVWTQLGALTGTTPTGIRIDLGAGTDQPEPSPGTGAFQHLDICP